MNLGPQHPPQIRNIATSSMLTLALLLFCGCEKESVNVKPGTNWIADFDSSRSLILTGRWDYAESAWMHLGTSKARMTRENLAKWISFQIKILESTQDDPLKEPIRIMAVQEIGRYPQLSHDYLPWLRASLATNFFEEPKVAKKAREVVSALERETGNR
jgi:hypothetical protein